MVARISAAVIVVGVVPGALWITGLLPPPEARSDVVPFESRTTSEQVSWSTRVSAICGWEREQVRALQKAFRGASSPADVELLFKAAIRLNDESVAMFKRLDAPLEYRRELRALQRLFRQERRAIEQALDAFEARRSAAFMRAIHRLAVADGRTTRLLSQLGADGCSLQPIKVPPGGGEKIV